MIKIEKRVKIFHLPSDLLFVTGGVGEVAPLRAPLFQRHTRSVKREERLWKTSKDFAVL